VTSPLRDPQVHDDLLNFRLKRLFGLGGAPAVRICEGRFGLPRFEWRVLASLVEDGPASLLVLCDRISVEPARVSRGVSALCEKRLAVRRSDACDGRRVEILPTAAGARLYSQLFPCLAEVNRRLVAVLSDRELALFDRCLGKLTQRATELRRADDRPDRVRADRRRGGSRRVWEAAHSPDPAPAGIPRRVRLRQF
jgi:DNA-binding MarR family transcriptional regulator